jgi:hypothetical protein
VGGLPEYAIKENKQAEEAESVDNVTVDPASLDVAIL